MAFTRWVQERRLRELTGLSHDQIKGRRSIWVENRHWKWAADGTIWYNTEEIDKWVEREHAA
ncbi:excisionase family protein [Marinobacter sp. CA1]|uniref:excisionase family protein n=1 Tax=Marinobacter sp. CA1 TaxID=2817656 RepID=UPI001D07F98E|nr:excisionase family protein [Marinobacter sp. CA1]